ncbi:hypothetical protein KO566_11850, partial [Flavobacteriaceae bacterium XHP0103]|uniref:hypothetical protein n=1 Tax=Marixanthotalea marina TaxID=2844359 RepID=UPI00298A0295
PRRFAPGFRSFACTMLTGSFCAFGVFSSLPFPASLIFKVFIGRSGVVDSFSCLLFSCLLLISLVLDTILLPFG